MAYEIPGFTFTLPASTGILSSTSAGIQYRFVTVNASGQATFPANGAAAIGVLQNKPTVENQAASITTNGVSKVEAAGSTVAVGDLVAASSIGRVIAGSSDNTVLGRVVSGSSGSTGRILSVLLTGLANSTTLT